MFTRDAAPGIYPAHQTKEFCNGGRGLLAASLRRLQATPLLQTSLILLEYNRNKVDVLG